MLAFDILPTGQDLLGECPLWDVASQSLYWIDARRHVVRHLQPDTGAQSHWTLPEEIGSIALCESGQLLVALVDRFVRLDPRSGTITPLLQMRHAADNVRLNDGRVDRAGRFVVGSLVKHSHEPLGALYQLSGATLREVDRGFRVSNTTCFSPDGRWMYFADSMSRQILRYPYDTATGAVGPREPFIDIAPWNSAPDGATVDAEGGLWVALVLSAQLARFHPDGRLDRLIDCPVPYVTCPCFGGPELDTLYLTSIRDSGNMLRTDHPHGGALMAIRGTGARGLPEVRFDDRGL
ncbi:SMP-30/gluconolactonase/LRE family protein [Hydrogenophaga sp. OTU3427]|uniref:SMP-30/gluconolactonase/LRE family protein n=1 Tax=Hydrogenophaga sp. OTU3427 TaxID=3043856 RepID=UPI00313C2492